MGSAVTEYVYDDAKRLYAFIAVNSATLSTPISDWLTLRDRSCFKPDGSDTTVASDCGTAYMAFMYTILHETTHVVDAVYHYHPNPGSKDEKVFPFAAEIWRNISQPVPKFDFSDRTRLSFYGLNGGPKLPMKEALQAYRELSLTPFTSLYGSQSVLEDDAELFSWTYFTQVLHQHYSTTIREGSTTFTYAPMENPLVQQRAVGLVDLFN